MDTMMQDSTTVIRAAECGHLMAHGSPRLIEMASRAYASRPLAITIARETLPKAGPSGWVKVETCEKCA